MTFTKPEGFDPKQDQEFERLNHKISELLGRLSKTAVPDDVLSRAENAGLLHVMAAVSEKLSAEVLHIQRVSSHQRAQSLKEEQVRREAVARAEGLLKSRERAAHKLAEEEAILAAAG